MTLVVMLAIFGSSPSVFAVVTNITTATVAPITMHSATNDQLFVSDTGSIIVPGTPVGLDGQVFGNAIITNNGTIRSTTAGDAAIGNVFPAWDNVNPVNFTINNYSLITPPAGTNAIDFSTIASGIGNFMINQTSGDIGGSIVFPNVATIIPTLNIFGGAISGSVTAGQNNGALNVYGAYAIPLGQAVTNIGAINVFNGGTLTTTGNITNSGNMLIENGATVTVTGSININGNNFITNNGTLTVTGAITQAQNSLMNNGTMTVTGGTIDPPILGNSTPLSILNMSNFVPSNTISNVGVINLTGGTTTFGNVPVSTIPTGFSQFTIVGGAVANFTAGQGGLTVPDNATLTDNGTLNMNGNTITLDNNAIFNVASNFTTNGTIVSGGG